MSVAGDGRFLPFVVVVSYVGGIWKEGEDLKKKSFVVGVFPPKSFSPFV